MLARVSVTLGNGHVVILLKQGPRCRWADSGRAPYEETFSFVGNRRPSLCRFVGMQVEDMRRSSNGVEAERGTLGSDGSPFLFTPPAGHQHVKACWVVGSRFTSVSLAAGVRRRQ